jgi:predicted negative regulator of RcsB-dependent stress response
VTGDAADRVRTLLLRGDNLMKNARTERALEAFHEAREAASADGVDPRVRELVERRIESLRGLTGSGLS